MIIKEGSCWTGGDKKFFVISTIVDDNKNTWVHYRDVSGKEYSCYEESFLSRFSPLPA